MDETSSKFQKKFSIAPEQGHLARKKKLFFWTFYCDKQYFCRTLLSTIIALPCKLLTNSFSVVLIGVRIVNTVLLHSAKCVAQNVQDRVATAAETWVQWRSDFQSGSRVLKKVLWTFSYLYLYPTFTLCDHLCSCCFAVHRHVDFSDHNLAPHS